MVLPANLNISLEGARIETIEPWRRHAIPYLIFCTRYGAILRAGSQERLVRRCSHGQQNAKDNQTNNRYYFCRGEPKFYLAISPDVEEIKQDRDDKKDCHHDAWIKRRPK